jgi:hypothetical protein
VGAVTAALRDLDLDSGFEAFCNLIVPALG